MLYSCNYNKAVPINHTVNKMNTKDFDDAYDVNAVYFDCDPDEERDICPMCNGSGEGLFDGSTCGHCKGKGEL